jgi:L-2-hydroxyglutarate oxidase LhgO
MEADHGVPGLVNLFGIESPGLTASLAIAERVAGLTRISHRAAIYSNVFSRGEQLTS